MYNFKNEIDDKYIMYLRKSRKDTENGILDDSEILKRHEEMLFSLANSLNISKSQILIKREVISGETISARPVMQEVLTLLKTQLYKGVLVVEVERLARGDTKDQGTISETFKITDTLIITPGKIYDPLNENDEEYFEFGLFMSRREYKTIKKRLENGRIAAAKEGKFVGSIPTFGYNKTKLKGQKGFILTINEKEAEIVKLIFYLFLEKRMGGSAIAKHLDDLGINPRRNSHWSTCTIQDILVNPHYIGMIKFNNRVSTKSFEDGNIKISRQLNKGKETKEFVYVKGLHDAIIDSETFNKVQALRKHRDIPRANKNLSLKNPLAGILKCKKCGKTLTKGYLRGKNRLYCKNPYCNNVGSFLEDVETKIIYFLNLWLKNFDLILPQETTINMLDIKNKMLKNKENLLMANKKKRDNIFDLFEEKVYNKETFIERSNKINDLINENVKEIETLKQEIIKINSIKIDNEVFIPNLKNVLEKYYKCNDAQEKNQLLKSVIDKVYYLKEEKGDKFNNTNFEIWVLPKISSDFMM